MSFAIKTIKYELKSWNISESAFQLKLTKMNVVTATHRSACI